MPILLNFGSSSTNRLNRTASIPNTVTYSVSAFIIQHGLPSGGTYPQISSIDNGSTIWSQLSIDPATRRLWYFDDFTAGFDSGISISDGSAYFVGLVKNVQQVTIYVRNLTTNAAMQSATSASNLARATNGTNTNHSFLGSSFGEPVNMTGLGYKFWSTVALSAAEMNDESRVLRYVRSANLHMFVPLIDATLANNYKDYSGNGYDFTNVGTHALSTSGISISWGSNKGYPNVPVASGGSTVSGSVAEALTLSETVSSQAVYKPSIAELLSIIDSQSSQAVFQSSNSDTITASDAIGVQAVLQSSNSDTITATDAIGVQVQFQSVQSETLNPVDTQSNTVNTNTQQNETLNPLDTQSSNVQTTGSQVETLTCAEALNAQASYNVSAADSTTIVEVVSVQAVFNASQLEAITAADAVSVEGGAIVANISETVTLSEALNAQFIANTVVSEGLVLSDSLNSQGVFAALQQEANTLNETLSASKNTQSAQADTIVIVEQAVAESILQSIIQEIVVLTDTQSNQLVANATQNETINLSDLVFGNSILYTGVVESVNLQDSVSVVESNLPEDPKYIIMSPKRVFSAVMHKRNYTVEMTKRVFTC